MQATACIAAISVPATIPASNPMYGLPTAYVTAAAVKAPASIIPSSAILITPERSENKPPRAARINGVESRIVDQIKAIVKISAINLHLGDLHLRAFQQTKPRKRTTE